MTLAPGLRMDKDVLDPMKHYRKGGRYGWEERALWRDSVALFKLQDKQYRPPQTFHWLAELVGEGFVGQAQTCRYMVLGMSRPKNPAKVDFYRAEQMPLPLNYLTDEVLVGRLDEALILAEDVRGQLWDATRTLARFVLAPEADQGEEGHEPHRDDMDALMTRWAVERDYWVRLELPFRQLLETRPQDVNAAMTAWRETVRRTAWHALDRIAAARASDGDNAALERGFTALLAAHQNDLPCYLRQAVSFLKSREIPINWHQPIRDVQNWGHPEGYVQKAWARAFWSRSAPTKAGS